MGGESLILWIITRTPETSAMLDQRAWMTATSKSDATSSECSSKAAAKHAIFLCGCILWAILESILAFIFTNVVCTSHLLDIVMKVWKRLHVCTNTGFFLLLHLFVCTNVIMATVVMRSTCWVSNTIDINESVGRHADIICNILHVHGWYIIVKY